MAYGDPDTAAAGDYGGAELAGGPSEGYGGAGWDGGRGGDPTVEARAKEFRDFLGRYGLRPDDLMAIANRSATMQEYKDNIAQIMDSLGATGKLGEFGRSLLGMKSLYDEVGFYTPAERKVLGLVQRGFATAGLPGLLLGRLMRASTNVATDTRATARGVGFGLSDRATGLGGPSLIETAMPPGGGLTVELDRLRQMRLALQAQTQQLQDLFTEQAMTAAATPPGLA
jgi:hypothetical protein